MTPKKTERSIAGLNGKSVKSDLFPFNFCIKIAPLYLLKCYFINAFSTKLQILSDYNFLKNNEF